MIKRKKGVKRTWNLLDALVLHLHESVFERVLGLLSDTSIMVLGKCVMSSKVSHELRNQVVSCMVMMESHMNPFYRLKLISPTLHANAIDTFRKTGCLKKAARTIKNRKYDHRTTLECVEQLEGEKPPVVKWC